MKKLLVAIVLLLATTCSHVKAQDFIGVAEVDSGVVFGYADSTFSEAPFLTISNSSGFVEDSEVYMDEDGFFLAFVDDSSNLVSNDLSMNLVDGDSGAEGLIAFIRPPYTADDIRQILDGLDPGHDPGVWTVPTADEIETLFEDLTEGRYGRHTTNLRWNWCAASRWNLGRLSCI